MRCVAWIACVVAACGNTDPRISVGAAAITRRAMPELVARHHAITGTHVDVVYGASDRLAATAAATSLDALVLADATAFAGINAQPPAVIATTSLVLVGPAGAPHRFTTLREEGVLALGDPKTVPAGRYARSYLESLGIWEAVAPRVVYAGDVAGALALAQRDTTHVAIVYATDVADAAPLVVLDRASDGPAVHVAAAVTLTAPHRAAAASFVRFLAGPDARAILARHGFAGVDR